MAHLFITVAPRSGGYGDATATYIRRAMVPSRMYAKHQYNTIQGSECGNYVVLYIPIQNSTST